MYKSKTNFTCAKNEEENVFIKYEMYEMLSFNKTIFALVLHRKVKSVINTRSLYTCRRENNNNNNNRVHRSF